MKNNRFAVAFLILLSTLGYVSCTSPGKEEKKELGAASESPVERSPSAVKVRPKKIWTDWYKDPSSVNGLLALKDIRDKLLAGNLHDPHVDYRSYIGSHVLNCAIPDNSKYRTANGMCTDPKNKFVGAAGVAFGRNVSPEFIVQDPLKDLSNPSPYLISEEFFTRKEFKPVPFLNMLAAVWIQFMNHDWLSHGRNEDQRQHKVARADGKTESIDETAVPKSGNFHKNFGRVSINQVTHWWDASQIYGSSLEEQKKLRHGENGKLRMEVRGKHHMEDLLPLDSSDEDLTTNNKQNVGREMTGFRDNWWVGLSMLHTLFVKEHNAIADLLHARYAKYDGSKKLWLWTGEDGEKYLNDQELDEKIFQISRLINAAVMAKIHTVEWTPAILPNDTLKKGMDANWYGLLNPKSWTIPVITDFFRHLAGKKDNVFEGLDLGYVFSGIVGGKHDDVGKPFNITEEFTSVYRLHSLLPESLELKTVGNPKVKTSVAFLDSRNEKAYKIMEENKLADMFYSFGTQHPGLLELNNYPNFLKNLPVAGHKSIDLGAMDIIRDRERSVPRYNQFRKGIGLEPITKYSDFFPDNKPLNAEQKAIVEKFKKVYGVAADGSDNVEAIDLLVGTLAEDVRPSNFGFGETMFQIFILMASRRLMADRFYTSDYRKEIYTAAGISWVDKEGYLHQVIGRHMPELKPYLVGLKTAFYPWKTSTQ